MSKTRSSGNRGTRTVLAEKSNERAVRAPDDVLHRRCCDLCQRLLLLNVVQHNRRCRAENQAGRSTIEDLVGLNWGLDTLDDRIRQVPDFNELLVGELTGLVCELMKG